MTTIQVNRLHPDRDADLPLPAYKTAGAAGADIVAANQQDIVLQPGERAAIPTGLALAIPPRWEAQIRPRSGNALRMGLTVVNAPGTIDSDYRGEVKILLINLGAEVVTVRRGDRVAQLVFAPAPQVDFHEVDALARTIRGTAGFGSTGGGS